MKKFSRWVELYATTPSGKTLFFCRYCGTKSPAPTRTCPEPPSALHKAELPCQLLEELEGALNDEEGTADAAHPGGKVLFAVSEKEASGPNEDIVRYTVQWRTQESMWNSTELYLHKNMVKK